VPPAEVSHKHPSGGRQQTQFEAATHTINRNDLNALGAIALGKAKFEVDSLTVLADKGYHNGREITQCKSNNITTIVAHPPGRAKDSVTQAEYLVAKFIYNKIDDTYQCPQGETLKTTGRWHSGRTEQSGYQLRNTEHCL
jgi:hypothetical protein